MIKPFLKNQQVGKLNSIIDEANKTYLKESRLSNNLNFNILRVLSAFRLMYPQSPSSLYNAIIYITKNYNPSSYNQWKAAVNELSKLKRHIQKQKHNVSRAQIPSYMKTYQNSFNKQRFEDGHFQSKSFAQIKIPADLNSSDESSSFCSMENKDISQTNAETGKRQYYTKTDSTQYPQRNHYISFQPYHHISGIYPYSYFEKENINSTNIAESRKKDTSSQYIQAIRRDLAKTNKNSFVKSPVDQSFIKNIDSYQSPYLISQPDLSLVDPESQKMNERAYVFLRYNLFFKSFSSLLANTLVLQKAKQHKLKAQTQNRSNVLRKIFEAIKQNVYIQKEERQKQRLAIIHYAKNTKKKVLGVLKLIFQIRNKHNPLDTQQMNRYSYEFILALLLSTKQVDQGSQFDSIDFDAKIEQLINHNQIDKVCQIVKYFGNHSWIDQQNFQNLIEKYKFSVCKLAFKAIKNQQQFNEKFVTFKNQNLTKKAYSVLKSRCLKVRSYNTKILQAKGKRNQLLQQKVVKALLQMVYSKQLYSKRCEYLQKKTEMNLRMKIVEQWLLKAKQKSKRKQIMKENIKISQLNFNKFYKKYALRMIQQDDIKLIDKTDKLQRVILVSNSYKIFRLLKNSYQNNKQKQIMQECIKKIWYKLALLKWKSKTRKGKGIGIIFSVVKKYYLRSLISPIFNQFIELMNQIKQKQIQITKRVFRQWKIWYLQQVKKQQILSEDLNSKMNFIRKTRIIKVLQQNQHYQQQLKIKKQIRINAESFMIYLENKQKKEALMTLNLLNKTSKQTKSHTDDLKLILNLYKINRAFIQIRSERQKNMRIKFLNMTIKNNYARKIMDFINIQLLSLKTKKLLQIIKKRSLKQIGDLVALYTIQRRKNEKKALSYINQTYLAKAFIGLNELIRQKQQLEILVQKINQNQCIQILKDGIFSLRSYNKVKKLRTRLDKRFFFNSLKENKQKNSKYHQLCFRNRQTVCQQFFLQFKSTNNKQNNSKQIQEKLKLLQKWIFIYNIQAYYSRSLISKKYLFMSVKYRAMKICRVAFNAWKKTRSPKKLIIKPIERVAKGKERLSTDVMD